MTDYELHPASPLACNRMAVLARDGDRGNATAWFFDQTDMHRAKDVLGNVCCIMGNVPISLTAIGTPEQVNAYCKDLIGYRGKGGGYVIATRTQIDDGQEETIRAMVDLTKEYGVYKEK